MCAFFSCVLAVGLALEIALYFKVFLEEQGVHGSSIAHRIPWAIYHVTSRMLSSWVYRWESNGPFRLHPEEIEAGGWFDVSEVGAWLGRDPEEFSPSFRLFWRKRGVAALNLDLCPLV